MDTPTTLIEADHYSQFGPLFPRNGCGPASITTVGNMYYPGRLYTVPQAAGLIGNNGGFSTFTGMMYGLRRMDIQNDYQPEADMHWIEYMVQRGYPVIVLVDYASFTYRPYNYLLAHFVTVVGFSLGYIFAHDPLRLTGPSMFPRSEFMDAINRRSRYPLADGGYGYNYANQAIYPLRPLTRINRLMRQFRVNLNAVRLSA